MAPPPLLTLRDIHVTFGGRPVFEGVECAIHPGDRICLVGRNGSGKSTLMKVIAGLVEKDDGERFVQPGVTVSYLPQDPTLPEGQTVHDYVHAGLRHEEEYHRVDICLEAMKLDGSRDTATLSGGEGRRAAIARAIVSEPDILLLDEPTNHLDLPTIQWLEEELQSFRGAMMMISHDRTFLRKLSRQLLWLDRSKIRRTDRGYEFFDEWVEHVMAEEEKEATRINIQIAEEERYMLKGVTARRKRNMRRVRKLAELRETKANTVKTQGTAKLQLESGKSSGKLVIEATDLCKSFDEKVICKGFSTRVMRGDKIGLIGPNGAGKTTLLKILTGQITPDSGDIRIGTNLSPAYFDQKRNNLPQDVTCWDYLADTGGDEILVHEQPKHVVTYMRDFLFEERQARQPIHALSGGEKNRLMLAKLLASPTNFLVLDEPTNDLDMETLDLLQEMLAEYDGTLLLVSHDRDFLDRVVTSTIAVEGAGEVEEYPGGYEDYLSQRKAKEEEIASPKAKPASTAKPKEQAKKPKGKLSYKDQRELDMLPSKMEKLGEEKDTLEKEMANPDLFSKNPDKFQKTSDRLTAIQEELDHCEERWLELEMLVEELNG
ncbi:Holdfast attachment protein C [Candidatus Terasakiella magnetica]|uniref:ATP-binding protein Uup n=1 Tax=Candidatus Terasakiella magnetica TaxID=1867952 RepID=A0A1C3RIG5_9PROT|nr:ATP-binding cassette domain-containing protein [Candidatus Terasakiella magnetica]SCA57059.1 Holdfast attachment protein C [Candidatus Terasakiella magnetica]